MPTCFNANFNHTEMLGNFNPEWDRVHGVNPKWGAMVSQSITWFSTYMTWLGCSRYRSPDDHQSHAAIGQPHFSNIIVSELNRAAGFLSHDGMKKYKDACRLLVCAPRRPEMSKYITKGPGIKSTPSSWPTEETGCCLSQTGTRVNIESTLLMQRYDRPFRVMEKRD